MAQHFIVDEISKKLLKTYKLEIIKAAENQNQPEIRISV